MNERAEIDSKLRTNPGQGPLIVVVLDENANTNSVYVCDYS